MEVRSALKTSFLVISLGILSDTTLIGACPAPVGMPPQGEGWLFDGDPSDLNDWTEAIDEPAGTWKVVDGILIHEETIKGNHLFYSGSEGPWGDLELVCEFRTEIGTNSGVYFRTTYFAEGFPQAPFDLEAQVNNTSSATQARRTGNLIPSGPETHPSPVVDNVWTHMRVIVENSLVTIEIDGQVITSADPVPPGYPTSGTVALQGEGLGGSFDRIEYRNLYIRHLPVSSCDGWDQGTPSSDPEPPLGNSSSDECLKSELTVLGHYHFDGDLQNSAKNLYHLRTYGTSELSASNLGWMAQPTGEALRFNGEDDYLIGVFLDDEIQPGDIGESFTIETLIYVDHIKNQGEASIAIIEFGSISFGQSTWETEPTLSFAPHWSLDQWHHLRVVYDPNASPSEMRLYIDDTLVGQGSASITANAIYHWQLRVGRFEGYVDELRVSKGTVDSGGMIPLAQSAWRTRFFTTAELNDGAKEATHWGDTADFDKDGFTTLAEYYLGLDPRVPDGLSSFAVDTNANPIVIDYLGAKQATGMDFNILGSSNLSSWLPEAIDTNTAVADGLLFRHMRATLVQDYSTATRLFMSLGITPTP